MMERFTSAERSTSDLLLWCEGKSSERDLSTKPPRQSLTFRSRPVAGSSLEPTACCSELTDDPRLAAGTHNRPVCNHDMPFLQFEASHIYCCFTNNTTKCSSWPDDFSCFRYHFPIQMLTMDILIWSTGVLC